MPPRTVLLDTSFIVALENRDDTYHEKAKSLDRTLMAEGCNYLLHWGILLEIADGYARIGRRHKAVELLARFEAEEGYIVEPITAPLLPEALALYRGRPDKEWGLTDCISFLLMGQRQITGALTADGHFRQASSVPLLLEP